MTDEELANLLEFVLTRRPDRVADAAFGTLTPEVQGIAAPMNELVARLAAAEPSAAPSSALRTRILATLASTVKPRRALVVVDMINDHLTPGRPLEVARAREIVPALKVRLDHARGAGTPVVYVLDRHDPADTDLDVWGLHAVEGTEGALVWPALAPKEGDRIVTKPSYSGFFQSDLQKVLVELGVDTIELTGCSTEVQLLTTATDAMQLGFAVEVPPALQAGVSPEAEMTTLAVLSLLVPYEPSRRALLAQLHA